MVCVFGVTQKGLWPLGTKMVRVRTAWCMFCVVKSGYYFFANWYHFSVADLGSPGTLILGKIRRNDKKEKSSRASKSKLPPPPYSPLAQGRDLPLLCCDYQLLIHHTMPYQLTSFIELIGIDLSLAFPIIDFHWLHTPGPHAYIDPG